MGCSSCGGKVSRGSNGFAEYAQKKDDMNLQITIDLSDIKKMNLAPITEALAALRRTGLLLLGIVDERIFVKNQNGAGQALGKGYSTAPALVNASAFELSATALKKLRASKAKDGETYFFASYKSIREAQGLQTDRVDLQFTSQMRNDMQMFFMPEDNSFGIGFSTDENKEKMVFAEERYGPIMVLQESEFKILIDSITNSYLIK